MDRILELLGRDRAHAGCASPPATLPAGRFGDDEVLEHHAEGLALQPPTSTRIPYLRPLLGERERDDVGPPQVLAHGHAGGEVGPWVSPSESVPRFASYSRR